MGEQITRADLPIDWRALAREVLRRDGRVCQECGASGTWLYMERVGTGWDVQDLRIACHVCAESEWCEPFSRVESP